jgi:hypothetical protein
LVIQPAVLNDDDIAGADGPPHAENDTRDPIVDHTLDAEACTERQESGRSEESGEVDSQQVEH